MVASSLVCLPPEDAGGAGPKVESWAFGTDREGLEVLARNRVFGVRACKLCDDGVVVRALPSQQPVIGSPAIVGHWPMPHSSA